MSQATTANLDGMNQNALNAWIAIKATALWWSPIVAGFIGAFGTHLLTESRERKRLVLDYKKQEYRELLSALSDGWMATGRLPFVESKEKEILMHMQTRSFQLFMDRIFITYDLDLKGLRNKWLAVTNKYRMPNSPRDELGRDYEEIRDEIVAAANHAIVPKAAWQRLQFWKRG